MPFFNFFNVKNLFRLIWNVTFCKNVFLCFFILTISPILNLGSLSLISLIQRIYVFDFTSTGLILIVLWYVLLYLLTISSNLSIYELFETGSFLKKVF